MNPFRVLGLAHAELAHAKLLSWLLEEQSLRAFQFAIFDRLRRQVTGVDVVPSSRDILIGPAHFQVELCARELGRLDIVARFPACPFVLGIELKVWAGEQAEQLVRYQSFLRQAFSGYRKLLLFVAAAGYSPTTANSAADVPLVQNSWRDIAALLAGHPLPDLETHAW